MPPHGCFGIASAWAAKFEAAASEQRAREQSRNGFQTLVLSSLEVCDQRRIFMCFQFIALHASWFWKGIEERWKLLHNSTHLSSCFYFFPAFFCWFWSFSPFCSFVLVVSQSRQICHHCRCDHMSDGFASSQISINDHGWLSKGMTSVAWWSSNSHRGAKVTLLSTITCHLPLKLPVAHFSTFVAFS